MPNTLEPSRPERALGRRDGRAVQARLYEVEHYLTLIVIGNEGLLETTKIGVATLVFEAVGGTRWGSVLQSPNQRSALANNCETIKQILRKEFAPQENERRERDKLQEPFQRRSVSEYLNSRTYHTLSRINNDKNRDEIFPGLRNRSKIGVMKVNPDSLQEATNVALNADGGLSSVSRYPQKRTFNQRNFEQRVFHVHTSGFDKPITESLSKTALPWR